MGRRLSVASRDVLSVQAGRMTHSPGGEDALSVHDVRAAAREVTVPLGQLLEGSGVPQTLPPGGNRALTERDAGGALKIVRKVLRDSRAHCNTRAM